MGTEWGQISGMEKEWDKWGTGVQKQWDEHKLLPSVIKYKPTGIQDSMCAVTFPGPIHHAQYPYSPPVLEVWRIYYCCVTVTVTGCWIRGGTSGSCGVTSSVNEARGGERREGIVAVHHVAVVGHLQRAVQHRQ